MKGILAENNTVYHSESYTRGVSQSFIVNKAIHGHTSSNCSSEKQNADNPANKQPARNNNPRKQISKQQTSKPRAHTLTPSSTPSLPSSPHPSSSPPETRQCPPQSPTSRPPPHTPPSPFPQHTHPPSPETNPNLNDSFPHSKKGRQGQGDGGRMRGVQLNDESSRFSLRRGFQFRIARVVHRNGEGRLSFSILRYLSRVRQSTASTSEV